MRSILVLMLLCLPFAAAETGHVTLLTFSNEGGGTADLFLEIRAGTGAIFIDSFPLTHLDTQGSTRYANQIACDFLQQDCSRYDFFYTIRAPSTIVGGPSAGAAIAVLTAAVLDGQNIDQQTAMTGTINSGGIIGPVAGISAKVAGAKENGITKVLIPLLSTAYDNQTNISIQRGVIEEISNGILVSKVGTLEEALYEFTGKTYEQTLPELHEPSAYKARMEAVAEDLCARNNELRATISARNVAYNDTNNFTQRIQTAAHTYSRASFCFSSNAELNGVLLAQESAETQAQRFAIARDAVDDLTTEIREMPIETMSDLQIYAIVMERLLEAQDILAEINTTAARQIAYVEERVLSARAWMLFFGMPGKQLQLDAAHLENVCLRKITEADERINYVRLYSENLVLDADATLQDAYAATDNILCIFIASKAKAKANILASALSVSDEAVETLLAEKLRADDLVLRKQLMKDFFPVLGYSYMRYAEDLRDEAPYSALTFAEYALELSHMDMYFPERRYVRIPAQVREGALMFVLGSIFGVLVTMAVMKKR